MGKLRLQHRRWLVLAYRKEVAGLGLHQWPGLVSVLLTIGQLLSSGGPRPFLEAIQV